MYGVDTPEDFAEYILDEDNYWPDDYDRPAEEAVEVHPQGQVYIDAEDLAGRAVLHLLDKIDSAGLRGDWTSSRRLAVFEKRPPCDEDGCFAEAKGGSGRGHLCAAHARQAKKERMKSGLPPVRGEDY